jgi:uncharacterized protein with PQ loop repeat|tara:strand:+ start:229 stop:510 length:282 start_codon:yes stop_codon:yes gene_type:complete
MESSIFVELIGFLAGLIGLFAWLPQLTEVWINKRHEGISLLTLSSIIAALSLWVIYGIILNAKAMIISNFITLIFIGLVGIGVLRLRTKEVSI